jgi:hypothetical protein
VIRHGFKDKPVAIANNENCIDDIFNYVFFNIEKRCVVVVSVSSSDISYKYRLDVKFVHKFSDISVRRKSSSHLFVNQTVIKYRVVIPSVYNTSYLLEDTVDGMTFLSPSNDK